MCMEDVRIGRATGIVENLISDISTDVMLVDDDPNRMFFMISSDSALDIYITTTKIAKTGEGIHIPPNTPPLTISLQFHGASVTKRWQVIATGVMKLSVLQGTMNKITV